MNWLDRLFGKKVEEPKKPKVVRTYRSGGGSGYTRTSVFGDVPPIAGNDSSYDDSHTTPTVGHTFGGGSFGGGGSHSSWDSSDSHSSSSHSSSHDSSSYDSSSSSSSDSSSCD